MRMPSNVRRVSVFVKKKKENRTREKKRKEQGRKEKERKNKKCSIQRRR